MADKTKSYPRFSRALRVDMLRLIDQVGVGDFASKVGVTNSAVYRWLEDPNVGVQRATMAKVVAVVGGPAKANGSNGHAAPNGNNGQPPPSEFTLRVAIGVKRAERLLAHCDLHGVSMSQFVAKLIDERLDAEWGKEQAS
jgi:hypothetical protein